MLKSATSNQRKLGFTLSELLVSLAVLGLIAGLTVPSVVASVDRSRNRSVLKEAFQTISTITQSGMMNGDFTSITDWNLTTSTDPNGIVAYVGSKLGYTKQCLTTDIASDGCKRGWAGTAPGDIYNAHNARWILPNGAKLQAFHYSSFRPNYMLWTVTSKAFANDMIYAGTNPDTMFFQCNLLDTPQILGGVTLKAGQCGSTDADIHLAQFNQLFS